MALATQCPHCYTSFRVANDQLKLHAGMVRCGSCKQTFNGIEHLLAPGSTPKSPPSQDQPSENSASQLDTARNSATEDVRQDISDAELRFDAETVDPAVKVTPPPALDPTPLQKAVSDADVKADLHTTAATSSTQIDAPLSNETFEPGIESQVIDTPISTMSSDRSQASLLEIMNAEVVQENLNDKIQPEQQSGAEPLDVAGVANVAEMSNFSASVESDQMQTIESIANSSISENLLAESVSTSSALSMEFDLEESDLDAGNSASLKQVMAKSESNASAGTDAGTSSTAANANTNQLNVEADSRADLPEKTKQKENDSGKTQFASDAKKPAKKPGALTASLDFELSKEERESVDEIAYIHQLELETRAAVLDEATDDWSNHEPQSVQDGFIDSLKELKPILDDIGDFAPIHQASLKSNAKHQTLNDLRVSSSKTDSLTDLEVNSNSNENVDAPEVTPAFVLQAERAQRYGKWKQFGLGFGVFLFVLVGVAQTVYFLRSDIAAMAPQLKPQLLSICKTLSCQIKLPAQKSMLEITGSELVIVNEELSMNTLSVQIQNKSSTLQAWPHFDLTLKDRRGKDLLQKAFAPAQYLENKELLSKGMPANSESNHKIFFQLKDLKASDYKVDVFYP